MEYRDNRASINAILWAINFVETIFVPVIHNISIRA